MITRRFATPLLFGVLVLAAVVRFAGLGTTPLDAGEASRSVAAWWTVMPVSEGLSRLAPRPDSALLLGLDYPVFWVLDGASDLTARLVPAIAGLALVALALLLRSQSSAAAVAVVLLVAADPWLVAVSRRASGAILAAACAIACHLLLRRLSDASPTAALEPAARRQWTLWACAFGLLFISGSSAWDFLLPVAVAAMLASRDARSESSPRPAMASMVAAGVTAALVGSTTGFLQWRGPALLSSSLEIWLQSWSASLRESSLASVLDAGAGVLLYLLAVVVLAAWGLTRAWSRTQRSSDGAMRGSGTRAEATTLLIWLGWGLAMQLRSGAHPDAWLALEVPLLLAAALGLQELLANVERGGASLPRQASRTRRVALIAIALIAIAGALAGTNAVPLPPASLPAARQLAVDVQVLLARPIAERPRIEVVTGPSIDGVVAWYLKDVPLEFVAAPGDGDDVQRVALVSSTVALDAAPQSSSAPRYTMVVDGDRMHTIELR